MALVMASCCSDLCGIQRGDVALDGVWVLSLEVDIVDGELVVEPFDLAVDLVFWDPRASSDELLDCEIR